MKEFLRRWAADIGKVAGELFSCFMTALAVGLGGGLGFWISTWWMFR